MIRWFCALFASVIMAGCNTVPTVGQAPRPDQAVGLLEAGEQIVLRMSAQLLHGYDMKEREPSYDLLEDDRQIPSYQGELLLTDRRLLFIDQSSSSSWVSVPFEAVVRARPSRTPLLNYLVVWDADNHPDSFVVGERDVAALHQNFRQAMAARKDIVKAAASQGHGNMAGE